jgi:hypothetical protein
LVEKDEVDVVKLRVDHELGRNHIPQFLTLIPIKTKNIRSLLHIQIPRLLIFSIPKEYFALVVFIVLGKHLLDNSDVVMGVYRSVDVSKGVVQE